MRRQRTRVLATAIALVLGAVTMIHAGTRYAGYGPGWGPNLNKSAGSGSIPQKSQLHAMSFKQVSPTSLHSTSQFRFHERAAHLDVKQASKIGSSGAAKLSKSNFRDGKIRIDNLSQKLADSKKTGLANTKIGKINAGKLSKGDFSNSKMKIDGLAKKLTDSKKSDLMNPKLASADKLKSLNLQKSVGLPGVKPSDSWKAKASTTTVPSSEIPDNPKANATDHNQQISPDGTTRTDTWTLPDGSKLEETFTRANQNGPWIPTNQYTFTGPDGKAQYAYSGNNGGNPIGPWATKITPDNPGAVPPGNGGGGPANAGGGPGNGGGDPGNGGLAGLPGGNGGGFDPGTVIGPIIGSAGTGGLVTLTPSSDETGVTIYSAPVPVPQPRITTVISRPPEPLQQKCDIQAKLAEVTGLIAQLPEMKKAVEDGSGNTAVEALVKTIMSKLEEAEECGGSDRQVKAMIADLYKVLETILVQFATGGTLKRGPQG